ncbi:CDP-alcohol phosphatidyltransferase family protein [Rhodoblastus acidophilus]|uniref:CDP-alcohol phosphatidyltransferase family protein n=1 Tax=Rhodoblastus acidophilus TaxID=1074 RepID=A0A6N8DH84_RHOAC|nr:CDP-alcohol phosphatidyltransferase family protein [Rhodoblastus acidophilus]
MELETSLTSTPTARVPNRIQTNLLARSERRLLNYLCSRLPAWVTPDGLTALSFVGALLSFASYVAARFDPAWLFGASLGLVVYWFGDSLDGSLARHRKIERPKYGYFIDHSVDALSNLVLMAGLGLSSFVSLPVALLALIGYYLLGIHVFISAYVTDEFKLTFLSAGPTELRLLLVALNTIMFIAGAQSLNLGGHAVSLYDAPVGLAALIFLILFLIATIKKARELL